jgi:hypothetical protein
MGAEQKRDAGGRRLLEPGRDRVAWAVWARTPTGEQDWLAAVFDLEEDAKLYRQEVEQGRRIRPRSAGHAGSGAVVEKWDGVTRLGTGRERLPEGGGDGR